MRQTCCPSRCSCQLYWWWALIAFLWLDYERSTAVIEMQYCNIGTHMSICWGGHLRLNSAGVSPEVRRSHASLRSFCSSWTCRREVWLLQSKTPKRAKSIYHSLGGRTGTDPVDLRTSSEKRTKWVFFFLHIAELRSDVWTLNEMEINQCTDQTSERRIEITQNHPFILQNVKVCHHVWKRSKMLLAYFSYIWMTKRTACKNMNQRFN